MRPSKIVIPALAAIVVLGAAAGAVAGSVPAEPDTAESGDPGAEARVEAGLTALDEVATDAGFVGDGFVTPIYDPVGIGSTDDPNPTTDCFADFAGTVAEDGSLTGQIAGSASPTYYQTGGDTMPEDGSELDLDQVDASAAILDAEALPPFTDMVEAFGSDELADCFGDAIGELQEGSDVEDLSVDISAESLDVGDVSSMMTVTLSGTFDGEENTFSTAFGMAVASDAVVVVNATGQSDELSSDIVTDSLEAMTEAMAG
jgi:hypothetical protein